MAGGVDAMAFWTVVAATAPVLGLALVLEARWLIANGESAGFPNEYVRGSSISSGIALLALAMSEINAMIALLPLGDEPLGRASAAWSLVLATSQVMLLPAFAFMRFGLAGTLARIRTAWAWTRFWWALRPLRTMRRQAKRQRKELMAHGLTIYGWSPSEEKRPEVVRVFHANEALLWQTFSVLDGLDNAEPRLREELASVERNMAEAYRWAGLRQTRALTHLAARLPTPAASSQTPRRLSAAPPARSAPGPATPGDARSDPGRP